MVISLESDQGVIDVMEGDSDVTASGTFSISGFSYGAIPLRVSFLNYSAYESRGFNLRDDFASADIPQNSADGE